MLAVAMLALVACGSEKGVCEREAWPEDGCGFCLGPVVTCTFEDVEVTEQTCQRSCQARRAVLEELCDQGSTVTIDEVESEMVCTEVGTSASTSSRGVSTSR